MRMEWSMISHFKYYFLRLKKKLINTAPSLHSLSISLMRTSLCSFGAGNAWLWYGFDLYVVLVLGMLGCGMVLNFPLIERILALFSSHLKCRQKETHIL
jgi:hypothetical protein